jgi:high-affinity iron transporter
VSPVIEVSGSHVAAATAAVVPVTVKDLAPANAQYETYAAGQLADLSAQIGAIQADLAGDDVAKAKTDWMAAQEDWERVGASYDSFGEFGEAVDGLPEAYQGGVNSAQFTGLHRLEYGLWHNQPVPELQAVTTTLADNVLAVQQHLSSPDLAGDPINLPIRAHEILEDALRDHLSGQDDEGSGAAYAETYADTQVTGIILGYLGPQLTERAPGLLQKAQKQLATLQSALEQADVGGSWNAPDQVSLSVRQHIDSAIGAALEILSSVPDVLEVPPHP